MAKQLSPFEQAFKDARADGKKDFEFNGKKYNTKYKEEDSGSSKSSTRAARPTSTETRSAPEPRESAVAASNDQTSSAPSSAPSSDSSSSSKSWWTTPNKNLQEGTFPSGKEIRSALGSSYKKGGSVSSRADGIAQRGKTRGKIC
jgi:hypothetical protein